MRSIKKYKFSNKQPIDLTSEELLELTNQITTIEYLKRNDITKIQTSEDAAQEILAYAYEKQARGKKRNRRNEENVYATLYKYITFRSKK